MQSICRCTNNKCASSRCVKLVSGTCFYYSNCKNCNTGVIAISVLAVCAKPVAKTRFCFFYYKNHNMGAAAISMPATRAFYQIYP